MKKFNKIYFKTSWAKKSTSLQMHNLWVCYWHNYQWGGLIDHTCTRLPSLWQNSCEWCTSWSTDIQPQSPGSPTEPAVPQTPGYWRSSGYSLRKRISLHHNGWCKFLDSTEDNKKWVNLLPGGILQTVAGCQPYLWLQLGLWTKMALSLRHSANTSPPI